MQTTQHPPATPPADPGFKLPGEAAAPEPLPKTAPATAGEGVEVVPGSPTPVTDTSTRDLAIGATVFVALLIIYFFVRNAYVHHLVVRRVAPSAAGSAGWLMFAGLGFLSGAAVLAVINTGKFLNIVITGPLVAVGLIACIAALFIGRR